MCLHISPSKSKIYTKIVKYQEKNIDRTEFILLQNKNSHSQDNNTTIITM